jgi:hypothetical protein
VIIDCDSCEVRNLACDDCVVSVLLGGPPQELDEGERLALGVLAESGLVPPLRLVPPVGPDGGGGSEERGAAGSDRSAAAG